MKPKTYRCKNNSAIVVHTDTNEKFIFIEHKTQAKKQNWQFMIDCYGKISCCFCRGPRERTVSWWLNHLNTCYNKFYPVFKPIINKKTAAQSFKTSVVSLRELAPKFLSKRINDLYYVFACTIDLYAVNIEFEQDEEGMHCELTLKYKPSDSLIYKARMTSDSCFKSLQIALQNWKYLTNVLGILNK